MQRVLLVSPGQPSLNPRLVKEADALADAGYEVTVLYSYWNNWGDHLTKKLLLTKKWKAVNAGGHPTESPAVYFLSRIIHKLANWSYNKFQIAVSTEFAVARAAWFLSREARKHKADLYIGHNLGALPAVVNAAKKHKAKCGFDAEDFHRQEVSDNQDSFNYKIAKHLEDKYYNRLDYLTTSSPQITGRYRQLYPQKNPVTLLNVFPKSRHSKQRAFNKNGPLKIFWFSQTIGINRGIEDIAKALQSLKPEDFELHLLGYIAGDVKQQFINNVLLNIKNVVFHDPIPSDEIIDFAAQFDIGLAAENSVPLNRDICLTNKIFTYLQTGVAILASNTTAQNNFLEENKGVGEIYDKGDINSLTSILSGWQADRQGLFNSCEASLKLGHDKFNWENEHLKFLSLINETLNKVE